MKYVEYKFKNRTRKELYNLLTSFINNIEDDIKSNKFENMADYKRSCVAKIENIIAEEIEVLEEDK